MWESKKASARLLRGLLTPLSWLYSGGWQCYLLTYTLGLKGSSEPHRPVLCVGNLVAGGSGKSPVTLHVAQTLRDLGYFVVIGCSGYGAPRSEGASIAPEVDLDPAEWGDEPAMFRWLAPDIPLIVGRDRVRAAELCAERCADSVLLMDDGFQHLPVRKHLTLLLDPPRPNRKCLPAGPYREPWRNRKRADLTLPNGFQVDFLIGEMEPGTPGAKQFGPVKGVVNVLCAIGDPQRFLGDLRALGFEPESVVAKPDHDDLQAGNLMDPLDPNLPVVTTAKDWVKLKRRADIDRHRVFIARQKALIKPEDEFRAWLQRKLDELKKKSSSG